MDTYKTLYKSYKNHWCEFHWEHFFLFSFWICTLPKIYRYTQYTHNMWNECAIEWEWETLRRPSQCTINNVCIKKDGNREKFIHISYTHKHSFYICSVSAKVAHYNQNQYSKRRSYSVSKIRKRIHFVVEVFPVFIFIMKY